MTFKHRSWALALLAAATIAVQGCGREAADPPQAARAPDAPSAAAVSYTHLDVYKRQV